MEKMIQSSLLFFDGDVPSLQWGEFPRFSHLVMPGFYREPRVLAGLLEKGHQEGSSGKASSHAREYDPMDVHALLRMGAALLE